MAKLVERSGSSSFEMPRSAGMDITINIGKENSERQAEDLTIVSTPYYVGNMVGKI